MNPLIGGGWELGFAQMASAARKARMTKKPPLIRPKLALLKWLIVGASLVLSASHPAAALDAVSLQLKWKHQFQFAGYYQALEQGFYRDAGLDVTIREGGPGIDAAEAVASGKADFGVCTASVLRDWTEGRRLVVLAAIFQRSPAVILVARRADIGDRAITGSAASEPDGLLRDRVAGAARESRRSRRPARPVDRHRAPAASAEDDSARHRQPRALRYLPYGRGRGATADVPGNPVSDRPAAGTARASMNGTSGQMQQTT